MKYSQLTFLLTLIVVFTITASGLSMAQNVLPDKTVTVDLKNVPVLTAAAEILKGTDIGYMCDKGVSATISISMKDTPLPNALSALLTKSNTTGRIENNVFIISPRPKPLHYTVPIGRSATKMRVGLTYSIGKVSSISIASSGPADIVDASSKRLIATIGNEQVTFNKAPNGIEVVIMGKSYGIMPGQVRIQPTSDANVLAVVSPRAAYTKYAGILEATSVSPRMMIMINEVSLEDYVRGAIPAEVPASFNPEAQKAIALAIRTYASTNGKRHEADGYNVCDSVHCQGFAGASRESEWVDTLLAETDGQVITYNAQPIHSLYSTDCGGITQSIQDAGMGNVNWPYLQSVIDMTNNVDNCAGSPHHIWSKTLTSDEINKAFALAQMTKFGAFKNMDFVEYDTSGRVKTVVVTFEKGQVNMTGTRFREILGLNNIKSTKITLTTNSDGSYTIMGKGFGHGLGLCIFGANGLSKARPEYTYQDIIRFYYTGTQVMRIMPDGTLVLVEPSAPTPPSPIKPEQTTQPVKVQPAPSVPQPAKPAITKPTAPAPIIKPSGPQELTGRAAKQKT